MAGTMLAGMVTVGPMPAFAQDAPNAPLNAPVPPGGGTISTIDVHGAQRLEPDTVRSYVKLRPGQHYTREDLDQAIKDLYATELFADVVIRDNHGALTIDIRENPVINRIVLEGNKRIKDDKIQPEIKLAPRQIFTRSKVRADVARIIELYKRQGRFAATVEPKMVQLDQNRVDVVFEIHEGDKSKIRQINIIGNDKFSDAELRAQMVTKQARFFRVFSSGDVYDPDRLAYDQQKLRQFYLTHGYADFQVVSAVAELTPDKKDFIITYVVQEGDRYKFGDANIQSDIRDLKADQLAALNPIHKGDWYNAKTVEDTVDKLTQTAGLIGYAFADVEPDFQPDKAKKVMNVTFKISDAPRVYVERVDVTGNTYTQDKVIRREFRLAEGDAFNSFRVKRSTDRIKSLGYFQDDLTIDQKPGSTPDRVVLQTNVQEKSTGEFQVSAGYSSLEKFIVDLSIEQRNFLGKGQDVRASVEWSAYSKSARIGFTEPYIFDKNIALGFDIFRNDLNQFNYTEENRNTIYEDVTTGFQVRTGLQLTEYWSLALRYGLSYDQISLDKNQYYSFINGVAQCDPVKSGRYLCDALGNRTTSAVGFSIVYDNLNNRIHPSSGSHLVLNQDLAGVGGGVRYLKTSVEADKYFPLPHGFILSLSATGGYIRSLDNSDVRLTDRYFLGEPQIRGFDIRGVGPRVIRIPYDTNTSDPNDLLAGKKYQTDDALGGNAYYLGHAEVEIPLGSSGKELGLRPSIFTDVGSVFSVKHPSLIDLPSNVGRQEVDSKGHPLYTDAAGNLTNDAVSNGLQNTPVTTSAGGFKEFFYGDTPKPRLSVGIGVNWNSPFGPFRIDVAKALLKQKGDDTKLVTFNVGTQF